MQHYRYYISNHFLHAKYNFQIYLIFKIKEFQLLTNKQLNEWYSIYTLDIII